MNFQEIMMQKKGIIVLDSGIKDMESIWGACCAGAFPAF